MAQIVNILLILTVLAVAGVLALGVISFIKGGAFYEKYANHIMRWRVGLQGAALILLVIAGLLKMTEGGAG